MKTQEMQVKGGGVAFSEPGTGGDGWLISGLGSTYELDLGGDIVRPGSYAETLRKNPSVPITWAHDRAEPIGQTTFMAERPGLGLVFEAKLEPTTRGKDAKILTQAGILAASIGYYADKSSTISVGDQVARALEKITLFEIGLTAFPMNPGARLTGITTASQATRGAIKDALTVARVEDKLRRGYVIDSLPKWEAVGYAQALHRELEREINGGLTDRELRYNQGFQVQQAIRELESELREFDRKPGTSKPRTMSLAEVRAEIRAINAELATM